MYVFTGYRQAVLTVPYSPHGVSSCYKNMGLVDLGQIDLLVELRVLGLATVADDVAPELTLATIASVGVLGAFRASPAVKAALAPRTTT